VLLELTQQITRLLDRENGSGNHGT
jgi:hypothetical protein